MSKERLSNDPSYTYPADEKGQAQPQEQSPVSNDADLADFDPIRAAEELQQYASSLNSPALAEPLQPFIFVLRPDSSRYNPVFMLTQLMLMLTANGNLVAATEHNKQPHTDEPALSSTVDGHSTVQHTDLAPSSTPLDSAWTISGLTACVIVISLLIAVINRLERTPNPQIKQQKSQREQLQAQLDDLTSSKNLLFNSEDAQPIRHEINKLIIEICALLQSGPPPASVTTRRI